MDKFEKSLVSLGLTEHESVVYLAALALGPSPVLRLARRAGIKRTTTYSVLDSLQARGLIRSELRGLKNLYAAEDPINLKRVMETRMFELNTVLPDLVGMYQEQGRDILLRSDGVEGVKSMYERLFSSLKRGDPYNVIGGSDGWYKIDPTYQSRMLERKLRFGVDTKLLLRAQRRAAVPKDRRIQQRQEVRILPESFNFSSDIIVLREQIAVIHMTHPYFGILITSPDIVATYHALFNLLWEGAAPD